MANLKEIRSRITSVSSTRQITSAMKMVSAAKLKRAQDAIVQLRPYSTKLTSIIQNISASVEVEDNPFAKAGKGQKVLVVPITSNRGLCGGFNSQLLKKVNGFITELKSKGYAQITVLSAGKKSHDFFKKTEFNIKGNVLPKNINHLINETSFEENAKVTEIILDAFLGNQFDTVYIAYNAFKNAAVQVATIEQFLPIDLSSQPAKEASKEKSTELDYIFEPNKEEILNHLIPKALKTQFYKAFIDSNASEHGARMTAMHKATDNASELIKELKLTYNKARQAAITNEILEIVAGAEALNG